MVAVVMCCVFLMTSVRGLTQEVLDVRGGDHEDFSRIVFDWQETVGYRVNLSGDRLEIIFDKALRPNWHSLPNEPLAYLSNPEYHIEGGKLIVTLKVTKPGKLRHTRYGSKIAFDIVAGEAAGMISTPKAVAVVSQPLAATEKHIVDDRHVVPTASHSDARINTVSSSDSDIIGSDLSHRTGDLKLAVKRKWDNMRLSYPWHKKVRAAAFIRHNYMWVVFDDKTTVDQTALGRFIGQRVLSVRQIDHPTMTVLMYELVPGQHIKVQKIGTQWHIDMRNAFVGPALPILSSHQRVPGSKGENFFFAIGNVGNVLRIEDPVIGDQLAIMPTIESSQGVHQTRKFTEFISLSTAQGIAVQLIADHLNIVKYKNGVSIAAQGGLALSHSQLASKLGPPPELDEDTGQNGGQNSGIGVKLVDFATWKIGPLTTADHEADYYENKHELLYRLSNSTDINRDEMRWNLARYYLANGRAREAFGVLSVMLDEDKKLGENPEFRSALAVTNILMRRYEEGAKLLTHKALLAERDVLLWSVVANSALGKHKLALENYKKASDILHLYDPDSQIRFLFAAIRSGYEVEDKTFVKLGLSLLQELPLNASQLTEMDYWQALLERDEKHLAKAEETLQGIVKAGVRQTAAWAKYDLINMELNSKKIDEAEAVDQLEKLRFAWRGDDFELELLSRLGDLYVAQNEFNTGLKTLRLAVTFFDTSKKTAELTRQMSRIYRDLFLNGGDSVMQPIKAVALYSEYRELIPLGKDGDTMTRRLVDRLVSLDLLEEGADLLKHQIKFRLKGVAQSVVASRLAMIYLLDSRPEDALGILMATRSSQIPDDIMDRRRMIEARTLIELGRFEEAEVMIEGYDDKEAEDLRTDIYWKAEDWDKYIRHENRMMGNRYDEDGDFNDEERLAVLRLSVAYVINDDKAGMKILRDRYKAYMDNGLYGDTFEVITAEKQLTDLNVRRLTRSIASVSELENFMTSYKAEFTNGMAQN